MPTLRKSTRKSHKLSPKRKTSPPAKSKSTKKDSSKQKVPFALTRSARVEKNKSKDAKKKADNKKVSSKDNKNSKKVSSKDSKNSKKSSSKDNKKDTSKKQVRSSKRLASSSDSSEDASVEVVISEASNSPRLSAKKAKTVKGAILKSKSKSKSKSPKVSPSSPSNNRAISVHSSKTIKLAKQVLAQVQEENGLAELPEAVVIERAVYAPRAAHRKRINWTPNEVRDLTKGVQKYGEGNWAPILKDPSFRFNPSRTAVDLKDKYRNMTAYVGYKDKPIRRFILVDSRHQPILTSTGNYHTLNNRIPREAALKVASKDKSYPVDERGNRPDTCLIYLRELIDPSERNSPEAQARASIVHVYRGTRTLQPANPNLSKFEGYSAVWQADVEKLACEQLLTAGAILRAEEEEELGRKNRL